MDEKRFVNNKFVRLVLRYLSFCNPKGPGGPERCLWRLYTHLLVLGRVASLPLCCVGNCTVEVFVTSDIGNSVFPLRDALRGFFGASSQNRLPLWVGQRDVHSHLHPRWLLSLPRCQSWGNHHSRQPRHLTRWTWGCYRCRLWSC